MLPSQTMPSWSPLDQLPKNALLRRLHELTARRGGSAVGVVAVHLVLAWGLLHAAPALERVAEAASVLSVRLIDTTPTRSVPEPTLAAPSLVQPQWQPMPVPEVPVPNPEKPVERATAAPAATAQTAVAVAAYVEAASAPLVAAEPPPRPAPAVPPPERQVAITQVAYLEPPVLTYPLAAKRQRLQGQVQVRVRVDEQGRTRSAVLVQSSGHDVLDAAALQTVHATRFKPYTENGVAKPFSVLMPLSFELES